MATVAQRLGRENVHWCKVLTLYVKFYNISLR